ncbi:alpha/beta fold hydrolase [Leptospira sp. GIMC2001]|uniref:alpha/beta fold hydrolase n=1 Tax=Leptospira sp. GIMC2001 TaxID=1513297 RepID=UPI00234BE8BF|nr:alpha/beta fold hydrolase [Leptospira sp. GIMC2001]WCL50318.1 alpha/beta fold hydrolase [Leptospira sp. GIMC2001]
MKSAFLRFGIISIISLVFSCAPDKSSEEDRETTLLLLYNSYVATEGIVYSGSGSERTAIYYKKVGTGIPVVVLHGGPGLDHNYLVQPLSELLGSNHQLIFFDQRGTGFSRGEFSDLNAGFINKTKFLEDLEAVRVGLNLGDKINILGHSWGGLYAMLYASNDSYKAHVKSLALVGSSGAHYNYYGIFLLNNLINKAGGEAAAATLGNLGAPLNPSSANYLPTLNALKAYYSFLFKFYFADYTPINTQNGTSANFAKLNLGLSAEKTIRNGLAVGSLINLSLRIADDDLTAGFFSNTKNTHNIVADLAKITVPVKLIHGADDVIPASFVINTGETYFTGTVPSSPVSVQTGLTNATVTTHLISNCGHFPFLEQPEAFRTALSGFFQ